MSDIIIDLRLQTAETEKGEVYGVLIRTGLDPYQAMLALGKRTRATAEDLTALWPVPATAPSVRDAAARAGFILSGIRLMPGHIRTPAPAGVSGAAAEYEDGWTAYGTPSSMQRRWDDEPR